MSAYKDGYQAARRPFSAAVPQPERQEFPFELGYNQQYSIPQQVVGMDADKANLTASEPCSDVDDSDADADDQEFFSQPNGSELPPLPPGKRSGN